jgi:hypothetical protein
MNTINIYSEISLTSYKYLKLENSSCQEVSIQLVDSLMIFQKF